MRINRHAVVAVLVINESGAGLQGGVCANLIGRLRPPLIAGSCARAGREPRQVRKEATVPAVAPVPQGCLAIIDGRSL